MREREREMGRVVGNWHAPVSSCGEPLELIEDDLWGKELISHLIAGQCERASGSASAKVSPKNI